MKDFFRRTFGNSGSATMQNGQFHTLYEGVVAAGSGIYGLIIQILILALFLMSGVIIVRAYTKEDRRQQQEEKDKLMTNIGLIIIAVSLSALIARIYLIFHWT